MKFLWLLFLALSALLFIQTVQAENEDYQTVAKTLDEGVSEAQLANEEDKLENFPVKANEEVQENLEDEHENVEAAQEDEHENEDAAQEMIAADAVEAFKDQPEMVRNFFTMSQINKFFNIHFYLATFSTQLKSLPQR